MRVVTMVLLVMLAACGSSAGAGPGGGDGDGAAAAAKPGGLTVEEALATDARGPLLVTGSYVHATGQPPRLCSALLESYPPQCGEPSLVVEGLDESGIEGLEREGGTTWASRVTVTGPREGKTITIDPTVQS